MTTYLIHLSLMFQATGTHHIAERLARMCSLNH